MAPSFAMEFRIFYTVLIIAVSFIEITILIYCCTPQNLSLIETFWILPKFPKIKYSSNKKNVFKLRNQFRLNWKYLEWNILKWKQAHNLISKDALKCTQKIGPLFKHAANLCNSSWLWLSFSFSFSLLPYLFIILHETALSSQIDSVEVIIFPVHYDR